MSTLWGWDVDSPLPKHPYGAWHGWHSSATPCPMSWCLPRAPLNPTCLCPGQKTGTGVHVLPQSYWYELLYGTILLALCLVVCLVGASIYAKATFLIFLIVAGVLGTILVSFFATRPLGVPIRMPHLNSSETENGNFTGFSLATLRENLGGEEQRGLSPALFVVPSVASTSQPYLLGWRGVARAPMHQQGLAGGCRGLAGTKQMAWGGLSRGGTRLGTGALRRGRVAVLCHPGQPVTARTPVPCRRVRGGLHHGADDELQLRLRGDVQRLHRHHGRLQHVR